MTAPSDILTQAKHRLWLTANRNLQTCVMAAANINIVFPADTAAEYDMITAEVTRMRENPINPALPVHILAEESRVVPDKHDWKLRYQQAHEMKFSREHPAAYKDGHYSPPVYPKVNTANGLTAFIVNLINWTGYNAVRINVSGRLINKVTKEVSGNLFLDKKMIKSSTRKGEADVRSTIKGRSYQWEIKIGKDKPSQAQLRAQQLERRAGGEYYFVRNTDEFLTLFDAILYGE